MTELAPHSVQWSTDLADRVVEIAKPWLPPNSLVWDPCAGVCEVFHTRMGPAADWWTFGSEIEREWADWYPFPVLLLDGDGWPHKLPGYRETTALGTITADSTTIPERFRGCFDGVVTSLTFDSRMNDRYVGAGDAGKVTSTTRADGTVKQTSRTRMATVPGGRVERPNRAGYAPSLGRLPTSGSAAGVRGSEYRRITASLVEAMAVGVRPGGVIVCEIKDALETDGRIWTFDWLLQYVTGARLGPRLRVAEAHAVPVPGYRNGQNRETRVTHSQVLVLMVG